MRIKVVLCITTITGILSFLVKNTKPSKDPVVKAWSATKYVVNKKEFDKQDKLSALEKFLKTAPDVNPYEKQAKQFLSIIEKQVEWTRSQLMRYEFTKTEVTQEQYQQCVEEHICEKPKTKEDNPNCTWSNLEKKKHPINCVTWKQATTFCNWVGGRLPTQQEWHTEASNNGKTKYTWGNSTPSCDKANVKKCCATTATVCERPKGNSISGLCDMTGNVAEWTETSLNKKRIVCGGSYQSSSFATQNNPLHWSPQVGFRCLRTPR